MRGFFVHAGYTPHFLQNLGHSGMHRPAGPQASMPAYAVRACPSVLPSAHIWFALTGLGLTAHTVMLAWFPMIKWGLMDCQAQPVPYGYRPPYQQASMAQSYATPPPQNYMQRPQVRFFLLEQSQLALPASQRHRLLYAQLCRIGGWLYFRAVWRAQLTPVSPGAMPHMPNTSSLHQPQSLRLRPCPLVSMFLATFPKHSWNKERNMFEGIPVLSCSHIDLCMLERPETSHCQI